MLPKLMGAAVFSIGFFMLLLGLADLLGVGGLNYDFGKRILVYLGGLILVLIGYFMARRLPRVEQAPEELVKTTNTEVQEPPLPPDHF